MHVVTVTAIVGHDCGCIYSSQPSQTRSTVYSQLATDHHGSAAADGGEPTPLLAPWRRRRMEMSRNSTPIGPDGAPAWTSVAGQPADARSQFVPLPTRSSSRTESIE